MLRRILFIFLLMLAGGCLSAQTPVENVIIKYEDVSGARNFVAQGVRMILARKFIQATPVAPIASDVDALYVLKMQDTPHSTRVMFVHDLDDALKAYEYYGRHPSKNGEVDVYVHHTGPDAVDELVIYNPAIYSLNSLYGNFTVQELLALDKNKDSSSRNP